jgi:hypothetical protein
MIVDKNLQVSAAQALTASALSDYSVNISSATRDIGAGKILYAIITIDTSVAGADAAKTVTFSVVTDSTADLATSARTILSTEAYVGSVLTAGRAPIVIPIPMSIADQYIGVYYTLSDTFTSFTLSACFGFEYQSNLQ